MVDAAGLGEEDAAERERKRAGATQDDQPASKKKRKPDAEEEAFYQEFLIDMQTVCAEADLEEPQNQGGKEGDDVEDDKPLAELGSPTKRLASRISDKLQHLIQAKRQKRLQEANEQEGKAHEDNSALAGAAVSAEEQNAARNALHAAASQLTTLGGLSVPVPAWLSRSAPSNCMTVFKGEVVLTRSPAVFEFCARVSPQLSRAHGANVLFRKRRANGQTRF